MRFNGCGNDEMYEPVDMDDDDECEDCMWASDMFGTCVMENECNLAFTTNIAILVRDPTEKNMSTLFFFSTEKWSIHWVIFVSQVWIGKLKMKMTWLILNASSKTAMMFGVFLSDVSTKPDVKVN